MGQRVERSGYRASGQGEDLRGGLWSLCRRFNIPRVCNTYPVMVLRVYLVRKDVVGVGGMMEDSQLLNMAIPAPVMDECPSVGDGAKRPRKYCTQGYRFPLQQRRE